jgi:chorismate synthase
MKQESLDNQGNITEMTGKGRHDPCVPASSPYCGSDCIRLTDLFD